jgi:hypothetical protein
MDALQVFFSENRFVVAPPGGITWHGAAPMVGPPQLPVSKFLTSIVPSEALQFLQVLEVVFSPLEQYNPCATYCPAFSAQWRDWVQTIKRTTEYFNFSRFTLRLVFAGWVAEQRYNPYIPPWRIGCIEDNERAVLKNCIDIIAPLKHMKGLQ